MYHAKRLGPNPPNGDRLRGQSIAYDAPTADRLNFGGSAEHETGYRAYVHDPAHGHLTIARPSWIKSAAGPRRENVARS